MKTVYKLSESYFQHFDTADDIIVWSYSWNGERINSVALNDLINAYYYEN